MLPVALNIICSLTFVTRKWKLLVFVLKYYMTENDPVKMNVINHLRTNVTPGTGGFLWRPETGFEVLWQRNSSEILITTAKEICDLCDCNN